ncbi:DUF305 domain-containing protein [Actinoplanes siamensis]|uniref:Lipoprotein n=1 Tax=Actinoplanes siamensis TaxID=1223317 RepID=A0A919N9F7_9ACTN|nr:DUF305 domain-containing protein [Actinoplanes siamensis]GIF06705.1 lipoprotein [Actinoplanes siamensis]
MNRQAWMGITGAALIATALFYGLAPSPESPEHPPPGPPPVRVVLPGRPGESAAVSDSDQVRAPDGSTYNSIDVAYAQMMIAHHAQAVEMAGLAGTRAGSAEVRGLAGRIGAAQRPEIDVLRSWLRDRGKPENDPGHDHAGMPGMQSAEAMGELAASTGGDFDRRFVTMMIAHHRGAQQMAGDLLRGGTDQRMSEMANETAVEQGSEINRLKDLGLV